MKTPPKCKASLARPKKFRKFGPFENAMNKSFKSNKKYVDSLKENNAALVRTVAALRREVGQLSNNVRHNFNENNILVMEAQMCKERIARANTLIKEGFSHLSEHTTLLMSALEEVSAVLTILTPQQQVQMNPSSLGEQPPSPSPSLPLEGMMSNSSSPGLDGNNSNCQTSSPGAACDIATPTRQGAAKPMVQGHTISKPTVSLQRVRLPLRKGAGLGVQNERGRLSDVFEESSEAVRMSETFHTPHENVDENYDCNTERDELECESGNDGYDNESSSESEVNEYSNERVGKKRTKYKLIKSTKSSGDGLTSLPQVVLERLQVSSAINLPLEENRSPIDVDEENTGVIFGSFHPVEEASTLDNERKSANGPLTLPVSHWTDDWADESSSEDDNENLALQIAESKKSYLEPARQVHLKEGTSWNYDDKGKYHSKPIKKRGRKAIGIKRKSSELTNSIPQKLGDVNVTLLADDFENNDMSLTQPVNGMLYENEEQSRLENRTLLENPAANPKKRKESLGNFQLQVSLPRLEDNTASRQPSDRMMYVTQRNSKERAVNHSLHESDGIIYNRREINSLSKNSLNSSPLKNSPHKPKKFSVESPLKKSSTLFLNSPSSSRKRPKETSVATSPLLNDTSSPKSLCDSPSGKRKGVHILSTSPFKSWVRLERLPSETRRRPQRDIDVPTSSRASNEDRSVELQRRSLSTPRKSSCSQSAISTYSPTNLKSPISTKWGSRNSKVSLTAKSNGDIDPDDDDNGHNKEDDNLLLKTSKRKHKSIKTSKQSSKGTTQSKQLSRKSNSLHLSSTSGDVRTAPSPHVSELTVQNVKSLSSDMCVCTVSDSDSSSFSSDLGGMRPRRLKAPRSLKEPSLVKKMRR